MSKVSYFTEYSQKENQITNNVLVMFSHLYNESPKIFQEFLNLLIDDENILDKIHVGVNFNQQEKGKHSVPDALINQNEFSIYIEAKIGDGITRDQMERHINTIKDNKTKNSILFSLTNNHVKSIEEGLDKNIIVKSITYRDIVKSLDSVVMDWQINLKEMLDDFKIYLQNQELIPIKHRMLAIACGTSHKQNIEHRLYFCPQARSIQPNTKYIGIYTNKNISHIGKIEAIVAYDNVENLWYVDNDGTEIGGNVSAEHKDRVLSVIKDVSYYPLEDGGDKYFLFDEIYEVNLEKDSPYAIQSRKYFDLEKDFKDDLEEGLSFKEICKEVEGSKWK